MNNSTEQLLRTKSNNLLATSTNEDSLNRPIAIEDFNRYSQANQFKTTYHLMDNMPIPSKEYFIPKYTGFVPGMKSENSFGNSFTKASRDQLELFDKRQRNHETKEYLLLCDTNKNRSIYNPLSKAIGSFFMKNKECPFGIEKHEYDSTRSQSGYSINLLAKSPAGIICPNFIEPIENNKTEYRSHYNQQTTFHYKCPLYSTGILKQSHSRSYV